MPESNATNANVQEVKRKLMGLLRDLGMAEDTVALIKDMQPYKVQKFAWLYEGYRHRPDHMKEKIRGVLQQDKEKPHIKDLIEKAGNNWSEDEYVEFSYKYFQKALALEFIKTEMHEVLGSLNSKDRTAFMATEDKDGVIF